MSRRLDLAGSVGFFAGLAREMAGHKQELEAAAVILEKEANALPGEYQDGWPALQPETIARKDAGDSPLLETGSFKDGISHNSDEHEAYVGSDDARAKYFEFGTSKMPARPVFAVAKIKAEEEIKSAVGKIAMERLVK
jgi:phage gpG-like protein